MNGKPNFKLQQATAVFKCGNASLTWDCPFCGDHNKWSFSNLPPLVAIPCPIPCFCNGCQKEYAIDIHQKFTEVATSVMN
jgi:hypothetical protein